MLRGFICRPLAECALDRDAFSQRERDALAVRKSSQGAHAARLLAKELLLTWLTRQGASLQPHEIEIMPSQDAAGGPPELILPQGLLPPATRLHLSLSHSAGHAAALVVVEGTDELALPIAAERTVCTCSGF